MISQSFSENSFKFRNKKLCHGIYTVGVHQSAKSSSIKGYEELLLHRFKGQLQNTICTLIRKQILGPCLDWRNSKGIHFLCFDDITCSLERRNEVRHSSGKTSLPAQNTWTKTSISTQFSRKPDGHALVQEKENAQKNIGKGNQKGSYPGREQLASKQEYKAAGTLHRRALERASSHLSRRPSVCENDVDLPHREDVRDLHLALGIGVKPNGKHMFVKLKARMRGMLSVVAIVHFSGIELGIHQWKTGQLAVTMWTQYILLSDWELRVWITRTLRLWYKYWLQDRLGLLMHLHRLIHDRHQY